MKDYSCQNISSKRHNAQIATPDWAKDFPVARFASAETKRTKDAPPGFEVRSLADFFNVIRTDTEGKKIVRAGKGEKVDYLPAWSLTQKPEPGTGSNEGTPNGLFQLDFDHVKDPNKLKSDLATIPGILFAAISASGGGVFALMYAPDHDAGVWIADAITNEMRQRGNQFGATKTKATKNGAAKQDEGNGKDAKELDEGERDKRCDKPHYLRYESYDAAPYIAPTFGAIAPDYAHALERSNARRAFVVWTNQSAPDYESAATAIFAASLCGNVASEYGGKAFTAACDVQILGKSGCCKTEGRTKPLRALARQYEVEQAGGLRTTDAALYDQFIMAAFDIERDDKGKIKDLKRKPIANKLACILDESGDTERSRAGNGNKAQQNLIRRTAYDGDMNIGATAEQQTKYNFKLPATIPARLVTYRICTPNQIAGKNFDDEAEGGNARRVLYAKMTTDNEAPIFDAVEAMKAKGRRMLSPFSEHELNDISKNLDRDCNGIVPKAFKAELEGETRIAYQAARLAFMRAGIDVESCLDTCIFNTCAWLCALRNACAPEKAHDQITANEIDTACALFLNSFALVKELRSEGAQTLISKARTDSERQDLIIKWLEGKEKRGAYRKDVIRKWGREVIAVVEDMLKNGILREVEVRTQKSTNMRWELTPDGEQEEAAETYAKKQESKRPKSKHKPSVFDGNTGAPMAERLTAYLKKLYDLGEVDHTHNDDSLRKIAGKIRANADFMQDEAACFEWFRDLVFSPDFDTSRKNPYTEKDVERLWRPLP